MYVSSLTGPKHVFALDAKPANQVGSMTGNSGGLLQRCVAAGQPRRGYADGMSFFGTYVEIDREDARTAESGMSR